MSALTGVALAQLYFHDKERRFRHITTFRVSYQPNSYDPVNFHCAYRLMNVNDQSFCKTPASQVSIEAEACECLSDRRGQMRILHNALATSNASTTQKTMKNWSSSLMPSVSSNKTMCAGKQRILMK